MIKPSIIILHGWGLSGGRFRGLQDVLQKKGYRVYVPDLPGFGATEPPLTPLGLSDYAQFIRGYMQKNKITRPVLIGHSFGGRVSLKYQMLFPGGARALVLTGTPGFTPVPRRRLALFIGVAKAGKLFLSVWPLSRLQEYVRKWYYYLVGARDYYRASPVMREVFKRVVKEDLVSCMKSVTVPCLLAWGADDRITPVWIARRMGDTISGSAVVIIPDADHGVSYKQPDRFVQEIENFLKTV